MDPSTRPEQFAAASSASEATCWKLVPIASRHLAGPPQLILHLVTASAHAELLQSLAALSRLATSMLVLVGVVLFTRHLVRRSMTVIVRRIRREQPSPPRA